MRIGIVVDSACDLPQDFIAEHNIVLLPITVRIGEAVLADHRDEQATLSFLHAHVAEHGAEAETIPFSVNQIRDLFLQQLVIDYDHVFCMTITKTRSPIHDNALQASFAILNDYKPVRQAAGHNSPFALRVLDTQNLFAAQAVTAVEAAPACSRSANAWKNWPATCTATWSPATCTTCAHVRGTRVTAVSACSARRWAARWTSSRCCTVTAARPGRWPRSRVSTTPCRSCLRWSASACAPG